MRFIGLVLILALGAAIGALFIQLKSISDQVASLESRVGSIIAENRDALDEAIRIEKRVSALTRSVEEDWSEIREQVCDKDIITKSSKSVYQVVLIDPQSNSRGRGTAWVIDQEKGVLATNAHVAEGFYDTGSYGEHVSMFVMPPDGSEPLRVTSVRTHAAYDLYVEDVEAYAPMFVNHFGTPSFPTMKSAFDVGLLYVDEPERLAPSLEVAPDSVLQSLEENTTFILIGYPQTTTDEFQTLKSYPRTQEGRISAVDHYLEVGENKAAAFNIMHNALTASGSSGSPLIDCQGRVLAIHSTRDSVFEGERGAQRADLARELVEERDGQAVEEVHRPEWNRLLKKFVRADEELPILLSALEGNQALNVTQVFGPANVIPSENRLFVCTDRPLPDLTLSILSEGGDGSNGNGLEETHTVSIQEAALECDNPLRLKGRWVAGRLNLSEPGDYLFYAYGFSADDHVCWSQDIRIKREGQTLFRPYLSEWLRYITYLPWKVEDNVGEYVDVLVQFGGAVSRCDAEHFNFAVAKIDLGEEKKEDERRDGKGSVDVSFADPIFELIVDTSTFVRDFVSQRFNEFRR